MSFSLNEKHLGIILTILTVAFWTGCDRSGPEKVDVSGTVTFDGDPVPEGNILFVPIEENGVPDAGSIVDGEFSCEVTLGKKKVEISASREEGTVDPAMGVAPRVPYIPDRYNTQTTLTEEVNLDVENEFHFKLYSAETETPPRS